jgi:hypothetical protein
MLNEELKLVELLVQFARMKDLQGSMQILMLANSLIEGREIEQRA